MSNENPPVDHAIIDDEPSGSAIEENIKSRSTWLRLVFMLVFYAIAILTSAVASVVVVLAFLWVLFTGERNRQLQQAGQAVASYLYEIMRYLSFNTDDKPFPFGRDFPTSEPPGKDA